MGLASVGIQQVRSRVNLVFTSLYSEVRYDVPALVLSKISNPLPRCEIRVDNWIHLEGLQLADPQFFRPGEVDILLGADIYMHLMSSGRRVLQPGFPSVMETVLGWIVTGAVSAEQEQQVPCHQIVVHHVEVNTEMLLQRFWELEEVPQAVTFTEEERLCKEHFVATFVRDVTGRCEVRLPFRKDVALLGPSRDAARRRVLQLERRLDMNPVMKAGYVAFMREYEKLGHMSVVHEDQLELLPAAMYYLPHHAVMKEGSTTTKLRVVFDASAKSASGVALNDQLMIGPKLQEDLFGLVVRFCTHRVAFSADIEKMYRQIKVNHEDVNFQRILWRESSDLPIQDFQLNTITYGTASAPFQAVRCLQEVAGQNCLRWPEAAVVTIRDFYMDDLMSGAQSQELALALQKQLILLMEDGGFCLRKWVSNEPAILEGVNEEHRKNEAVKCISADNFTNLLGLRWNPGLDEFSFVFRDQDQNVKFSLTLTKRQVLSALGRVYDPLGWLAPVTVRAKMMFQQIWKGSSDWDTPLCAKICEDWTCYNKELKVIEDLRIPRCLVPVGAVTYRLCGFADASERAYAAVVYLRSSSTSGTWYVKLVAAKTKIAPLKTISIPRLELCAGVLLVKLLSAIAKSIKLELQTSWCWSDSTIVLSWLASPSYRWKTFVANRVAVIQEYHYVWRHVVSMDNPADCTSRGISARELLELPNWWSGPIWLQEDLETGESPPNWEPEKELPEEKKVMGSHTSVVDVSWIERFSSLSTLQRVVDFCLRLANNTRRTKVPRRGFLSVQELESALAVLIGLVQQQEFPQEIQSLRSHRTVPHKSRLLTLNPFCDQEGILRVGGRLKNSKLSSDAKHPIILPRSHQLTVMLVQREHQRQLHAGPQLLLAVLQQKYWILCGRDVVRRVVSKCIVCHKQRTATSSQLMADLPAARVLPCPGAFVSTGVDFAGLLLLRVLKGRGQKSFKGYTAIFVCFATRAVHLELVSDLTTSAFIASLKRFVSRRGKPSHVYSDCGTNLIGANKILDDISKIARDVCRDELVHRYLAEEGIHWHFNPSGAPHFGGLWEAGVKSVKFHLRRVMGSVVLNYEEVATILAQVEACLNSRPLTQLSSDPDDLLPLTPGHFLVGRALAAIPEPDFTSVAENRLSRWELLQKMTQDFWKRWSLEYLKRLQQRPKWWKKISGLNVGDLVLIKEDRLAPMQWRLGRILELHSGKDGLVRVVTVKTSTGQFRRPVVKISPLPLDGE